MPVPASRWCRIYRKKGWPQINHRFYFTGVDYFGPFLVRQWRSDVKRYGCIFTCFTTRAVHLEVAYSLTADSFIVALSRFKSRRGKPFCIFSDNGINFVGAEKELSKSIEEWNKNQIFTHLQQNEIRWEFNPPRAKFPIYSRTFKCSTMYIPTRQAWITLIYFETPLGLFEQILLYSIKFCAYVCQIKKIAHF